MRLLTHNMMVCNVKACVATANRFPDEGPRNYPLQISPSIDGGVTVTKTQYSKDFLIHILLSIDWKALARTVKELNHPEVPIIPEEKPIDIESNDDLLKAIHAIIFDTNILEGELICRNCCRSYPISKGVPNMLLEEDEI